MKLTSESIEEFKAIYGQKYGVELSNDEAQERAVEMFNLYCLSQDKNILYD